MEGEEDPYALVIKAALECRGADRHSSHLDSIVSFLRNRSSFGDYLSKVYQEHVEILAKSAYFTHCVEKDLLTRAGTEFQCCHVLLKGCILTEEGEIDDEEGEQEARAGQ